ncbi:MAG: biopolymer transporter ExbD [Pirellulaceae bacterium]|nr:biopolymer transporter ExbD [Planctomycetales bacterium]
MRTTFLRPGGRRPLEIPMTPMIDVVFLLLVFFLWTASFQLPEQNLPVVISMAAGSGAVTETPPEQPDFDLIAVRLLRQDERLITTLNGQHLTDLGDLQGRLEGLANVRADLPVVIDPAADVPVGDVVDVYDTVRIVGFNQVQFAAERP